MNKFLQKEKILYNKLIVQLKLNLKQRVGPLLKPASVGQHF